MVKTKFYNLDTDNTLSSNSDIYIASQKAVKEYVDNGLSNKVNTSLDNISTTVAEEIAIATVATTGNYNDLTNKPDLSGYQLANTAVIRIENMTMGSPTNPVYIAANGLALPISYELAKSVPANAVFTDTTYSTFVGADGSMAGTSGLVPPPSATDNTKFLCGDGTWSSLPDESTVDQTYNASSINAQSGTAVAEAISGKQNILVSGTDIKTINSTTVLGSGNFTLADTSLSNLSNDGKMLIDTKNKTLTNCILELPHNIKIDLANNILTLRSGSILTKPGTTYATITTTDDKTYTIDANIEDGIYAVFCTYTDGTIEGLKELSKIYSGTSAEKPEWSADIIGHVYYDIDTMLINYAGVSNWNVWGVTYPICLIEIKSGVASFVKDSNDNNTIFNGCCFIGLARIYYPGIKFLAAYGFNSDGTLRSRKRITLSTIVINSFEVNDGYDGLNVTIDSVGNGHYIYDEKTNCIYSDGALRDSICPIVHIKKEDNIITDFAIRQPVHLATTEILNKKQDTLISGVTIKTINNASLLGSGNITVSGSLNSDGVTINANSSDQLQAIGVIEKNTGTVKYDWIGTLAEWSAGRDNNTIPDTWICYITDDESTSISVDWSSLVNVPAEITALYNQN